MLSIMWYLRDRLVYLRNERGIETMEWILIGGLITAVAIAIYPGVLEPALTAAVTSVTAAITAAIP